jgi:tripartite-type tricarboxylate transporter receptor subunit TctC
MRLVLAVAAVLALIAGCGDARSGGGSGAESTKLAPLADGFPNQPLTLLVIDEAGSQDGIYAREVQRAIRDISPVRVNVVDRPDFGTYGSYDALKWMQEQPGGKDGYINAVVVDPGTTMDLLNTPVTKELGVDIASLNRVIATEQQPYGFYTRKGAPWGSDMDAFVEYAKAHPGELTFVGRGPGSGVDIGMADYMSRLGITYKTVVGGSFQEIASAVAAGDGDFSMAGTDVVRQFHSDGRVEVLALTLGATPTAPWADAARMRDVTGQEVDPWGRNVGLFTTPETPVEHREWLYRLFKLATEQDSFKQARGAIPGNQVVALNHDEFQAVAQQAYDIALPLLDKLGQLDPSVKSRS